MKYGCRAHDYGCFTAQELAKVLADNGYNAAQLAMPKAIQGIKSLVAVTPEQLEDVRSAFAAANIEITVLSCYQDLSNPDAEVRRSAVSSVFSALKCQVTLGAGQVGSESACRDLSPEEKAATLPLLTDSILRIVEQAAQIGGCFALEPVYTHTLGTLEALQKLKETVADPQHFHIIFDPVNVLTADTAAHQAEFLARLVRGHRQRFGLHPHERCPICSQRPTYPHPAWRGARWGLYHFARLGCIESTLMLPCYGTR